MFSPFAVFAVMAAAVIGNGAIWYVRATGFEAANPTLARDGKRIAIGFVVWLLPIFAVHALGSQFGWSGLSTPPQPNEHPQAFDYLEALLSFAILGRGMIWVFFQEGAELLASVQPVLGRGPTTPRGVKVIWAIMFLAALLGGLVHLVFPSAA